MSSGLGLQAWGGVLLTWLLGPHLIPRLPSPDPRPPPGCPVTADVTHALQQPAGRPLEGGGVASGGLRDMIPAIARTGGWVGGCVGREVKVEWTMGGRALPTAAVHAPRPTPARPTVAHGTQPWPAAWTESSWRCTTTPPPPRWTAPRSGRCGAPPPPPPLRLRLAGWAALHWAGLAGPPRTQGPQHGTHRRRRRSSPPLSRLQAPAPPAGGAAGGCQGEPGQGGVGAGPEPCGGGL